MERRLFRMKRPKRKGKNTQDPAPEKIEQCPNQKGHTDLPLERQEPPSQKEQKGNQERNAGFRAQPRELGKISTVVDNQP